jgi:hypothetical protein
MKGSGPKSVGGSASVDATLWLARRFGVGIGANGGHETVSANVYTEGYRQDFAGGELRFISWLTARFALYCTYSPEWRQYDGANGVSTREIEHYVTAGVIGRLF